MSLKPICVPCHRFFRMKKAGVYFTEGMPMNGSSRVAPGTSEADKWKPYKVWSGDRWECEGCGATIISGTGLSPVAIQHEDKFEETRCSLGADRFMVNDC